MSGASPIEASRAGQGKRSLRRYGAPALALALAAGAVAVVFIARDRVNGDDAAAAAIETSGDGACCNAYVSADALSEVPPPEAPTGSGLPCIVVLGSAECCDECVKMRTMLEEMRPRLEGLADVVVVDTGLYPQEAQRWRLRLTPTEIVVDAEGTEIARLEGAMSREQVVGALKEAGIGVE